MRIIKRMIAMIVTIIIVIMAFGCFWGPMFIMDGQNSSEGNMEFFSLENDIITVSDRIIPSSVCIYIIIKPVDWADNLIWPTTVFHRVFYTSDDKLVGKIFKNMKLKVTGRDMATIESKMLITQNNKVIYMTEFVPDRVLGIQNEQYGWCEFIDQSALIDLLSQMKPYRLPVLYLN